jgi:hypothetical protein
VKTRFQSLPFKFNLQRYNTDPEQKMIDISKKDADGHPLLEKYLLRKVWGGAVQVEFSL